ncbi:N-terminal acetyltransferase complex ard1 subunit, putative [Entamoeba dispar SAW760]|uniref:N-terminal acetyltransferase complex ard1 subunit, putative n=2 Tax=Entamoeba dispar (strain ATCC PRA-260 / SAW760) TaxID=370354 RepID=B0ENV9_ENTDS|nr:N-terminal acetyltransferase complex ard1 subunit, putative [Entamoeba dispar SAW760]EDR23798.1 N-terminal acetyltransferase complex ard1 subunit, putative [Entamoeba dispar SAW760]|eukprot:EDR23798.1 N-terminal acetyltransferase complex ard1 subunit, putative [Entamoeba dispar SAW760]
MFTIRKATPADLPAIQNVNLTNLPENYNLQLYYYHLILYPTSFVAVTPDNKIVGYCLTKIEDDDPHPVVTGQVTSISVLRTYRRLGIATKLIRAAENSMIEIFGARAMMLQVRVSNKPALHLYEKTIGFTVTKVSKHYYLDGEDALILTHNFTSDTLINKDCSSVVVDEWKKVMQEQETKQKEQPTTTN